LRSSSAGTDGRRGYQVEQVRGAISVPKPHRLTLYPEEGTRQFATGSMRMENTIN